MMYIFLELFFFFVSALAGFSVHKKQYGFATYFILSALYIGTKALIHQ